MKTYNVKQADSNISINFLMDEFWKDANIIKDFTYPWENHKHVKMQFKSVFDKNNFYFLFEVADTEGLTYIKTNHKTEVKNSDRVELFFMSQNQMNPYYGLEMDSLGRIFDYKANFYREFDENWNWPEKDIMVHINKTKNGYNLYGQLTLSSLENLGILIKGKMQVGVYRGDCVKLLNSEAQLKWISWVKPASIEPDFHIPSSFGTFLLLEN